MKTYFEEQMQVINNAVKSLDTETFTQLVTECEAVLSDGHKIILSGLGKNVPVCEKFVGTMNSFGLAAAFMNTNTAVHGDIGMVQNGDLVIILTKSGDTSESVYLTSLLEQRNADLWLLSFQRNSTLAERIPKHVILDLEHEGDAWDITPNKDTSRIQTISENCEAVWINGIRSSYRMARHRRLLHLWNVSPGIFKRKRNF